MNDTIHKNVAEILIAIDKEYTDKIFAGTKKWELRKTKPNKEISRVWLNETKTGGKVVGYFEVEEIIRNDVPTLWELTQDKNGISYKKFMDYFQNNKFGVAFRIGKVVKLKNKSLSDLGISTIIQSWTYVKSLNENIIEDKKEKK